MESVLQTESGKRRALHGETRTLIRAILNRERLAKMDEMRQRRMERFAGHRPRHGRHRYPRL